MYSKRLFACLLATLIIVGVTTSQSAHAPAAYSARVEVFYEPLRKHGFWVEDAEYGMVWYPAHRPRDWNPYAEGRWIYTSEYGWYWDSTEPWGWATYHYGRWAVSSRYGWVWVPDEQWGPAWVEWRYGDGYVGWCPMTPDEQWSAGGYYYAEGTYENPRYRDRWVFVESARFSGSDVKASRAPVSRNDELFAASARVTNYTNIKGRVVNRSIDVGKISAASGAKIKPVSVVMVSELGTSGTTRAAGRIKIYRPASIVDTTATEVKTKLDLDLPKPDLDASVNAISRSSVGNATNVTGGASGSLSGSVGSRIETPSVGGYGAIGGGAVGGVGGLGVGGGGGLRLGR